MSIFDAYNEEFNSLSHQISKNICDLKTFSFDNDDKLYKLINLIDNLIIQANDLLKQINVEVRSHDSATRKLLIDKVQQYQKSILSHKKDFELAREKAQRSDLIGDNSSSDRQRLLDTNSK
jgi:vesicle transport through interaction with t-SNAREs protein 1